MTEPEYGEITIIDHGLQVTGAPEYARCTLEVLVGNENRGVWTSGNRITFGSFGQSVTYTIVGWDNEHACFLLRKGIG